MLPHVGPTELIIILIIVIIIFGAGKLPEIGGALGKGIKEFRQASKELDKAKEDVEAATDIKKDDDATKKS